MFTVLYAVLCAECLLCYVLCHALLPKYSAVRSMTCFLCAVHYVCYLNWDIVWATFMRGKYVIVIWVGKPKIGFQGVTFLQSRASFLPDFL